jgi:hypothetical protein
MHLSAYLAHRTVQNEAIRHEAVSQDDRVATRPYVYDEHTQAQTGMWKY